MATLEELADLYQDSGLIKKIGAALVIGAHDLLNAGAPTANDKAYAAKVFSDPGKEAHLALPYLLGADNAADVSAIQGAADSAIQTRVNAAIPHLRDAFAGV